MGYEMVKRKCKKLFLFYFFQSETANDINHNLLKISLTVSQGF